MGVKSEPQHREFTPQEAAASEAMFRQEPGSSIPGAVDSPSVAPTVDGGSSIVPSQVDSGNLAPKVR